MKSPSEATYDLAIQSSSARNYAYISVIADTVADREQITIHATTEADLIEKLATEYSLYPCPVKADIFRTAEECDRIRKERASPTDKTEYARAIGYTGTKPVIIQDGKVISHNRKDWFEFCADIHDKKRRSKQSA